MTSSTGWAARSDQPKLATTATVSATRPCRPVETSTGTPAGRGGLGAMARTERESAPRVAPEAKARTALTASA